jgi:hypothetical protein
MKIYELITTKKEWPITLAIMDDVKVDMSVSPSSILTNIREVHFNEEDPTPHFDVLIKRKLS